MPDPDLALLPSPSQDHSTRHADDARLRRAGFRIHSRPRSGEAVWEKAGVLFTHSEAMLRLTQSQERNR